MSKKNSSRFLPIIGILLFIFILYKIGLGAIWENLVHLNLIYFGIALLFLIPAFILRTHKWRTILIRFGFSYPFFEGFKVFLISYFIGSITPARIGDFSRALYLKDRKIPLGKAVSSVLIDRIFDLGVLILMAAVGVFTFIRLYALTSSSMILILFFILIFCVGLFLVLNKKIIRKLLRPFFYLFVPDKYKSKLIDLFDDFYTSIKNFIKNPSSVFIIFIYTLLIWLIGFLSIYFIALALNIQISYFLLILILPFTTLVEMLPVSFSGMGTRDAVLVFMFSLLSISASEAVSFSLMILVLNYILNLIGAFFWIKKPFKI